jgi:DNA-binding PadR family transcriptional regulator
MEIFDNTMARFQHKAVRKKSYQLTELGKRKAEEMAAEGDRLAVLTTLDEEGAATTDEISNTTHIGRFKVQMIMNDFIRAGYIQKSHSDSGDN